MSSLRFQDSLGGNAKTAMFLNVWGDALHSEGTLLALTNAARVKLIANHVRRSGQKQADAPQDEKTPVLL